MSSADRGNRAWSRSLFPISFLLLGALFVTPTLSEAALTKSQQRCVKVQNTDLRKVTAQIGKRISICVKKIGSGTDARTLSGCVTDDDQGRIARATSKTMADDARLCQGNDSHGDPKAPAVFYSGAPSTNAAATSAATVLIPTVFGAGESVLMPTDEPNRQGFSCQQAVASSLQRCQAALLLAFEKCKTAAMRSGATTPAELIACLGSDPRGAVAAACVSDFQTLLQKDGRCTATGVTMAFVDSYSGVCPCADPFDGACLDRCLARPTTCAVCGAINQTDALGANCDVFDDGLNNGSCGSASRVFVDPPSSLLR